MGADHDTLYGKTVSELVEFAAKARDPEARASLLMLADLFKKLAARGYTPAYGHSARQLPGSDGLQN